MVRRPGYTVAVETSRWVARVSLIMPRNESCRLPRRMRTMIQSPGTGNPYNLPRRRARFG